MTYPESNIISNEAYLWIYNNTTRVMKKYTNVEIYQIRNIFTRKPRDEIAIAFKEGVVNRTVSKAPYEVMYYPTFRDFLIWSYNDEDERIKQLILENIIDRSIANIKQCTDRLQTEMFLLSNALNGFVDCIEIGE